MTFAEKCKKYRTQKRLTQQQTASLAGISKRAYVYYESGKKVPRKLETIKKLADLFGVELNELMVIDDERFLELRKKRPVNERAEEIISELNSVLSDGFEDRAEMTGFINRIKQLCSEFEAAEPEILPDIIEKSTHADDTEG